MFRSPVSASVEGGDEREKSGLGDKCKIQPGIKLF